jgi:DNA gyrase subunit B
MEEEYDSSQIVTLEVREGVRMRPAMYVDNLNNRGLAVLLQNLFHEAVERTQLAEIFMKFGEDLSVIIQFKKLRKPTKINWFYSNHYNSFQWHLEVLNGLSERLTVNFLDIKGNNIRELYFEKGEFLHDSSEWKTYKTNTLELDFQLDRIIWKDFSNWNTQYLLREIWDFAFLHKNVKFDLQYTEGGQLCRVAYQFKNGLKDRIEIEKQKGLYAPSTNIWLEKKFKNFTLEAAFAFKGTWVDKPFLISYVNIDDTFEEGSHVEGLLKGIARGLTVCCRNIDPNFSEISTTSVRESIYAAVRVQMENPNYKGSVRQALNNPEIVEPIAKYVSQMLIQHIEKDADWRKNLTPDSGILYPLSK